MKAFFRTTLALSFLVPALGCGSHASEEAAHGAVASLNGAVSEKSSAEGPKGEHGVKEGDGQHGKESKEGKEAKEPKEAKEHGPHGVVTAPVPFAWEASAEEGLGRTRSFMRVFFADNASYVKSHDAASFHPFLKVQTPRATVLSCADSRVHTGAFDAHPENDVFAIRNIGNQITNAEGSVEYGVEHLHTKVLVVLGHTGCGAVKARMGDISKLSDAVRKELEPLRVPVSATVDDQTWADAVIANVNDQVAFATSKFDTAVQSSDLTVVGAVYDLRNDLHHGHGKITVVSVNGNTDPKKLAAFEKAITARSTP